VSSPSPIPGILPKIPLPPFSRIPILALYNYPISSGSLILPDWISMFGSGKLKIYVVISEAGYLGVVYAGETGVPSYLNGGNVLNANTLYEFEITDLSDVALNFIWYSSSSSVTSAIIYMWIYFEPDRGEESG